MSKKVIARWSRELMKKNGWDTTNQASDVPENEGYWRYLVRFDDGTGTFSKDGINPNERCMRVCLNGYFPFERDLAAYHKEAWDKVLAGLIPPDEEFSVIQTIVSICKCDSFQLTFVGHNIDCPEKKR